MFVYFRPSAEFSFPSVHASVVSPHRDLKGGNILIDTEKRAKIADFGSVKFNDTGESLCAKTTAGTSYWLAPEVLSQQEGSKYDPLRADVWSLGATVVEMATGMSPWTYGRERGFPTVIALSFHICKEGAPAHPPLPEDGSVSEELRVSVR
uniref:Protein kinase domain-containing protein n=1 Tax=Chromera velia CCMP2878 TaxID=1169474 RepID=A0A0G4IBA7_9ALVE|eukprot:Cvel_12691.t1-p1 / transcript=Cvel_12691.t1 / gene=Cvel_12691 / organism=Chromera_velia_CCMP2878 / gene_product=Mitogen-activated protein kinase kinase kinase NPK1, putative / transcript_product=Mitogen-activated protein kinase kinase kinase NPK1, putative / location=Cvel_scaffold840:8853-9877(-) / protein_length=150 / sequence_SO=supercontig / SO=protein_coding / is_pseudo=false